MGIRGALLACGPCSGPLRCGPLALAAEDPVPRGHRGQPLDRLFVQHDRTVGVPFIGPHAWHPEEVGRLDLAATTLELLLVVALVALARWFSAARVYVMLGALQAFGVGLVLHLLNPGMHEAYGISPVSHWLTSSAVGTPFPYLWCGSSPARATCSRLLLRRRSREHQRARQLGARCLGGVRGR